MKQRLEKSIELDQQEYGELGDELEIAFLNH